MTTRAAGNGFVVGAETSSFTAAFMNIPPWNDLSPSRGKYMQGN